MGRLRVLTWHIHGTYLYYLAQAPHDFFLPIRPDRGEGYGGRTPGYDWPDNVYEIPVEEVPGTRLDCVIFQSPRNYREDQHLIFSAEQRRLPKLYIEHDPPRQHPTDTRHHLDDPEVVLVHVTHFNDLMWDSGRTPTRVVEHGVLIPEGIRYTGELPRGIVVINDLQSRGRRLGADIFERARKDIPLDLAGINYEALAGIGNFRHSDLIALEARYRFFFNPIRYTSLGLSVLEAMMAGLPIVGLATTEMVMAIENEVSGFLHTDVSRVIERMRALLDDPADARRLGEGARRTAEERFNIRRFARDWDLLLREVTGL